MNTDALKNELLTIHKIRPIDIKIIVPSIQKRRYSEECIYILYFQRKDNIKIENLRRITGLFNIRINWKYYSSRSHGPTQCSNCQDFGHGTENCFLNSKCIRCGGKHKSAKCPHLPEPKVDDLGNQLPAQELKIPDEKVKCANCGQNHTANFRGCTYRKQYVEIQNSIKPRKINQTPAPRNDIQNFPHLPRQNNAATANRLNDNFTTYNNTSSNVQPAPPRGLLNYVECSQIMSELLSRLPNCHTIDAQIQLIYEISFRYTYGSSK